MPFPVLKNPEISVLEDKLYFKGVGGSEFQTYELDIELLKHINTKVLDIISLYLVLR